MRTAFTTAIAALLFSTNALAQAAPSIAVLRTSVEPGVRRPVRVALDQTGVATRDTVREVLATRAQRRARLAQTRETNIGRLQEYADRGVFPMNLNGVAYANLFRDEQGTYCAVANLIALTSPAGSALANTTATENNGVRLGEVHSGPLHDWILESGFTQEEIAAIQFPDMPRFGARNPVIDQTIRNEAQAHFRAVISMLRANTQASLTQAVARLDARPGPARAV